MKLRKDLILRKLGGEHIIVDPGQDVVDMSSVYTFNETAVFLWERLKGVEFTAEEAADLLVERYDVSPEQARRDVSGLLRTFREHHLLEA